jgi:hypothetical protein
MYDVMYGSVTNTCVKENPCMVLIPSSVSKSTGKYCLMKHCMVTLPFPILKSKGKYCMADKPSHLSRVSLSYPVEIGLTMLYLENKRFFADFILFFGFLNRIFHQTGQFGVRQLHCKETLSWKLFMT